MSKREESPWQLVLTVSTLGEAQIVKSRLEAEGIEAEFNYDATSSVILGPGSVTPWSNVMVFVPADQVEQAAELLDSLKDDEA